jgi:hypothetical protein
VSRRGDLLDSLARRSVGARSFPRARRRRAMDARGGADPQPSERVSRASALKLGAVGGASLLLGLGKGPEARAQTMGLGDCLALCVDGANLLLKRKADACEDVFLSDTWNETSAWRKFKRSLRYGPYTIAWDFWSMSPFGLCILKALADVRSIKQECLERCEDTCPPRRSLQSASSRSAPACEPKPPPKPTPPQIPPPPAQDQLPCPYCTARCDPCKTADRGAVCCLESNPKGACCPAG